jgi:hypothetical protein
MSAEGRQGCSPSPGLAVCEESSRAGVRDNSAISNASAPGFLLRSREAMDAWELAQPWGAPPRPETMFTRPVPSSRCARLCALCTEGDHLIQSVGREQLLSKREQLLSRHIDMRALRKPECAASTVFATYSGFQNNVWRPRTISALPWRCPAGAPPSPGEGFAQKFKNGSEIDHLISLKAEKKTPQPDFLGKAPGGGGGIGLTDVLLGAVERPQR